MDITAYCNSIETIVDPTGEQLDAVYGLLQTPGFATFLGLLLGAKQAQLVMLANIPLSTSETQHQASVTQGIVRGLDMPRALLLELFPSDGNPSNRGA